MFHQPKPVTTSRKPTRHLRDMKQLIFHIEPSVKALSSAHHCIPTAPALNASPNPRQTLEPYDTKPVIKASFLARDVHNHTAFVRIRTNTEVTTRKRLLIPLEVQVSSGNLPAKSPTPCTRPL